MSKIVIIGGGSYMWGSIFLRDIFTTPELHGSNVVLEDINPERMDIVYQLGQKMLKDHNLDFKLEQTTKLDEALEGADFVILTITTGGFESMRPDLEIPWKYGVRQSVGDTTGPGGLSRALRNIPVIAEITRKVDQICPKAFFLNYTNPMSTLTRTINMHRSVKGKTVGLCHEWSGVRKKLAAIFTIDEAEIQPRVAGINHLIWLTSLVISGNDKWDEMPDITDRILLGEINPGEGDNTVFVDQCKLKSQLFKLYGALPAAGDRHIAEFFPSFITEETEWGAKYGFRLTSIEDRYELEGFIQGMIQAALKGDMPLEPFMAERSGEAASEIITALTTADRYIGILNLPNSGQISNLPLESIVETYGVIDNTGADAIYFGDFSPGVQTIIEKHIRNQEMTVQAALTGDRELALQVLFNDPLSSRLSVEQSKAMLDELLVAHREYLPRFFEKETRS
jgi:alpha-galactosidase/6-phospho-beta-glucosidase family protein